MHPMKCGLSNIWYQQENVQGKMVKNAVHKDCMKDQFIQTRSNDMFTSPSGKIYRTFKVEVHSEKHLEKLHKKIRSIVLKNFALQITVFQ